MAQSFFGNRRSRTFRQRDNRTQVRNKGGSSSGELNYEKFEARHLLAATATFAFGPGLNTVDATHPVNEMMIRNHISSNAETAYLQQGENGLQFVAFEDQSDRTVSVFQQTVAGFAVNDAYITVVQNSQGGIEGVYDRGVEGLGQQDWMSPTLGSDVAERIANNDFSDRFELLTQSGLVWYGSDADAGLAWQVETEVGGTQNVETFVDAVSGQILHQEDAVDPLDRLFLYPETIEGVYERIVINDAKGASGSQAYAAPFDSVVALALGCTGTLIAPDVVLSARHCGASSGDAILFGDDSANPDYTATVQSVSLPDGNGSLLDGGDVSILTLTMDVPSSIATPMRLIDATDSLEGMTAATIGYGYNGVGSQGHNFTSDDIRWGGENIIDVYGTPADSSGSNIISTDFDDGTSGSNTISSSSSTPLEWEATTAPGDSGGPILVQVDGGEWVIAGVLSGGTSNTSVYGDISWWTGTAIYRTQIEAAGGVFVGAGLGNVAFDAGSYVAGDDVGVTVVDDNASSVLVTVTSDSGDSESLTLTNTSGASFSNSLTTSDSAVSTNDGVLQVSVDDMITVTYVDADNGAGGSTTVTDTATIIELSNGVLVGVDFDDSQGTVTNWLGVGGASNTTYSDLGSEDGGATVIDLTITEQTDGLWADFDVTPAASTIPQHANALGNINGQIYTGADALQLTYSDLTPLGNYEIYVMAAEGFYDSIDQRVTIAGDGAAVTFDQSFDTDQLFINDQLGDSSKSLSEYAQVITADANGEIQIDIVAFNNSQDVVLAGVAILELDDPSVFNAIGEAGTITDLTHNWQTITLTESFANPVVVFGPMSNNGDDPSTIRIRNVTGNSFEVQNQEFGYLNGIHTAETVGYVVLEAGAHELEDGTVVVAGNSDITHNWSTIDLGSNFSSTPVVMSQTITQNGVDAVFTRHQNVGAGSFDLRMQEDQAANQTHATETVSWIAIEQTSGVSNGSLYEAGVTGDVVTHADYSLSFASAFGSTPVFLSSMQSFDGADASFMRYRTLDTNDAVIYIDEEKSADSETKHTTENVGYFAFDSGAIFGVTGNSRASRLAVDPGSDFDRMQLFVDTQADIESTGFEAALAGESIGTFFSSEFSVLAGADEIASVENTDRLFEQVADDDADFALDSIVSEFDFQVV